MKPLDQITAICSVPSAKKNKKPRNGLNNWVRAADSFEKLQTELGSEKSSDLPSKPQWFCSWSNNNLCNWGETQMAENLKNNLSLILHFLLLSVHFSSLCSHWSRFVLTIAFSCGLICQLIAYPRKLFLFLFKSRFNLLNLWHQTSTEHGGNVASTGVFFCCCLFFCRQNSTGMSFSLALAHLTL